MTDIQLCGILIGMWPGFQNFEISTNQRPGFRSNVKLGPKGSFEGTKKEIKNERNEQLMSTLRRELYFIISAMA